jgi:CubicO group peptidase (beta-lactamase class C family)
MALAGEVVVAVSGIPYADYVQKHIIDPLGLKDTFPEIPAQHKGGRLATGYSRRQRDQSRNAIPFYFVHGIAPAAGFASTVEDLGRFASWQFRLLEKGGNEILSSNTLREMHRVHWMDQDWKSRRALGFSVWRHDDKTFVGHGGSCPGYKSHLAMCPKEKIAVIVMSNAREVRPSLYTEQIFDIISPAISDAIKSPGKAREADPDLKKFVGRYERSSESYVLIWQGELAIVYLPTNNPLNSLTELKRIEGNVFRRVRDDGSLAETVVFETGPDGKVQHYIRHSNYYTRIKE